jgi:outer membrane lipoprotein-sorting protein
MPAVAVPAVIAAGVLAGSIPVWAGDPLPEKTPAQVLALLGTHETKSFSGTLEQTSELGLPELPAAGPTSGPASAAGAAGGAASMIELLTGKHTARVFVDGPAKVRIQVVDRLAERDIIRRDSDLWFYTSKDNSAAHLTLPAMARDLPLSQPQTPAYPTPEALANRLLAALDSSTDVTVGPDVEVAGRTAYNLILEPRTQGTLVGRAAIAVDGQTGLPLKVSVTARGQAQPAFQSGFTNLTLGAPDDSLFSFVPPPGATVKEVQLPPIPHRTVTPDTVPGDQSSPGVPATPTPHPAKPSVTGSGWETVIGIRAAEAGQGSLLSESLLKDPLLAQAAVVVPGGRLLSTALVNVLLTDDGRIFVGMVPPERLQAAATAVAP